MTLTIGTGISAGLGLVKSAVGIGQMLFNKKPERPNYQMPTEYNQILGISKYLASQRGFPGQDIMQRNLVNSTAQGVGAVQETTTGGAGLGAVAQMYGSQQQQQMNLDVAGANAYTQSLQGVQQALGMIGQERKQEFEYNVNMPYQRFLQEYYQTKQSGAHNLFGGIQDISGAAIIYDQNQQFNTMMDRLYGTGQPQGQPQGELPTSFSPPEATFGMFNQQPFRMNTMLLTPQPRPVAQPQPVNFGQNMGIWNMRKAIGTGTQFI